jgi:arylesterase/paraoxonase
VKGLNYGSEDLHVTKDGLAFISSGFTFPATTPAFDEFLKTNNIQGNIYLFDFNKPDQGARKLQIKSSKRFNLQTFHPHGISLLEDEVKGEHLLYVINHPDNEDDKIEKFRYLPQTSELVHVKSFSGDKLQVTNDLALIEEDKFYITNYLYFKNKFLSFIEQILLPVSLGSLVYYNGTDFTMVDPWLNSPNGLFLSTDKR